MKSYKSIVLITTLIVSMLLAASCSTTTKYTVSFDTNGGTPSTIESQSVAAGGLATKPADPVKDGYKFTGWYAGDSAFPWNFSTDTVVQNVTLTAGWEKETTTHNVNVSWSGAQGATSAGKNFIVIMYYNEDTGRWIMNAFSSPRATVAGNLTSYAIPVDDTWAGRKLGAVVSYSENDTTLYGGQSEIKDAVLFDGTKDITLPEVILKPVN